jgi:hypothetical protein
MREVSDLSVRLREIVIPLVVGLGIALIQAIFTGPDLVRFLVYFLIGLTLATLIVLVFTYASRRVSRVAIGGASLGENQVSASGIVIERKLKRSWLNVRAEDLIDIAKMQNLTLAERDRLLAPYIGQWLAVEGPVADVRGTPEGRAITVSIDERNHNVDAHFVQDKVRASSLRKGVSVHVVGQLVSVTGGGLQISECEFIEQQKTSTPTQIADKASAPLLPPSSAFLKTRESAPDKPAQHGTQFSGIGVGKTPMFHAERAFGFRWTPSNGIVIGAQRGTLNEIPHGWTFDNNLNPYFPAKIAPPPDVPGDFHFTVDNIAKDTPWTITVLYDAE